jgi:hypothetical protein
MAYKYSICDVFHWFCKIARFFVTEPYFVSVFRHQYDVVGDLTIAMAKTTQFQCLSHPSHRWLLPPVAMVSKNIILKRSNDFRFLSACRKTCEGSLHPRLKSLGIRDPPRSQVIKRKLYKFKI